MSQTELHPADVEGETQFDEDDRLKPEFIRAVLDAVDAGDAEGARALVEPLHPADIADLFELTPNEDRAALATALADMLDGEVLAEMNDHVREMLIDSLEPGQVADIAAELDTDDAVAIIEDMDDEDQRAVLRALDPDDRAAIEAALSYPEESAGRMMQRELIAVPEHWTIGDVLDFLRADDTLTTDFWEIFVVDPQHKPVGAPRCRRRRHGARTDADSSRYGPGRGRAALPEIRADLRRGDRSGRAAGRHDHGR